MNRIIPLVIQYLHCVLHTVKIWHFRGKFDQYLSLFCGSVKPNFKTGPGYWFLCKSCELRFPKFTDNFGTVSSNIHLKAVFYTIEITWKKMSRSVCLKPVSMATWSLHTLWCFTLPAYYSRILRVDSSIPIPKFRLLNWCIYGNNTLQPIMRND